MSVNVLYVHWLRGWTFVQNIPDGRRRRERQVDITTNNHEEMERVSNALLDTFSDVRGQITIDPMPRSDAERGYLGYYVGDTVTVPDSDGTPTQERVLSMTASWNVDSPGGHPVIRPQLKDILLETQEAFSQEVERMNRGALGGYTAAAGVLEKSPDIADQVPEPFHQVWSVPTAPPACS